MVLRYSDGRTWSFYFYRGEMIERFEPGWMWSEESCQGYKEIPVYKTIEDVRNAIRMHLDGTHRAQPRVMAFASCDLERGFYIKRYNDSQETYSRILSRRTMI